MLWRSWLRHCAISRKDAGLGIFHSFRTHFGPGVDSDSNRNEYQWFRVGGRDGRCVGLITWPPSCSDCVEILGTSIFCCRRGLPRPVQGLLYLCLYILLWAALKKCLFATVEMHEWYQTGSTSPYWAVLSGPKWQYCRRIILSRAKILWRRRKMSEIWHWRTGGKVPTGGNWSTWRKTCPSATVST